MQAPPLSDQSENLSRNPTAFRPMYEQHSGWLKANVRRRFGSQDAEDIVQETWLRLASIVSLAEIRHPRAFLLRIATNLASTRHRRRDLALRAEAVAAAARGGIDADQADTAMFVQIILSLPQPLRDVFLLSRFGGLTNEQIAARLGIRPKTVEWRMTKALAHCAAQLRR